MCIVHSSVELAEYWEKGVCKCILIIGRKERNEHYATISSTKCSIMYLQRQQLPKAGVDSKSKPNPGHPKSSARLGGDEGQAGWKRHPIAPSVVYKGVPESTRLSLGGGSVLDKPNSYMLTARVEQGRQPERSMRMTVRKGNR